MTNQPKISDQLRHILETGEKSRYAISQETGIAQSVLSRFMHGKAGLSLDAIDKLGTCLGLTISQDASSNHKRK